MQGVILVFDITNPKSIQAVDQWRNVLTCPNILLCANKSDKSKHIIKPNSLDAYIRDCGYIGWHMTSAKSDATVREAFDFLIDRTLKSMLVKFEDGLPIDHQPARLIPVRNQATPHTPSKEKVLSSDDDEDFQGYQPEYDHFSYKFTPVGERGLLAE